MNDIKIGEIYQNTTTGDIKRVVFADNYCAYFREGVSGCSCCSIKDFLKYWKPYNVRIGEIYQHIPTGIKRRVAFVCDNYVLLDDYVNGKNNIYCTTKNFLQFWVTCKEYTKEANKKDNKENDDKVNHPSHYTWLKDLCGIEVIDITRHMSFNLGNSIKYILRSGHKKEEGYTDKQKTIEDLKKAIWYLNDEINMLQKEN